MIYINKSFKLFIIILSIVGLLGGIIYFLMINDQDRNSIQLLIENIANVRPIPNIISNQFILILIIILLSFSIIGFPIILFVYFYEAISFSFTMTSFVYFLGIKGFLFYLIYFIIFNLLLYLILIYLTIVSYEITIKLIDTIKHKYELNVGHFFRTYIYKYIVIILGILLFNTIMYFFGSYFLKLFIFI